jgi:hypothetical protein
MNAKAKLKIAKTAQEQDFEEPVLDAQIDFDEIYLNINKNQVINIYLDFLLELNFFFSIRIYLIYLNIKIIIIQKRNILNIIQILVMILMIQKIQEG